MAFLIYLVISFSAIYMFGSNLKGSFLDNMSDNHMWVSDVLSVSFLIIVGCHIPYIFFAGKESFLVMLDEIHRKQISKVLAQELMSKV